MTTKIITTFFIYSAFASLGAQTYTWQNSGEGLWSDSANWDAQMVPSDASTVVISNSGTAVMQETDVANLATFYLGQNSGESGTLMLQDSSSLMASGYVYVGNSGSGWLELSDNAQVSTGRRMYIANAAGSTSTLDINGGKLAVNGITSGSDGLLAGTVTNATAYINVNGGILDIAGMLSLGDNGGRAEVTLSSGQIIVSDILAVGARSSASTQYGSSGSITINDGGVLYSNGTMAIGHGQGTNASNGSEGVVTINSGGKLIANNVISVAYSVYSKGTLTINEGGVLESHTITSGGGQSVPTGASGLVVVDGGTIKVHDNFVQSNYFMYLVDVRVDSKGLTIDSNGKTTAIGSTITGEGKITKVGENFIYLVAGNSFSGGVDIIEGSVIAGNQASLGTGITMINTGASLESWISNTNVGGIDLLGGTLSANRTTGVGSYTLSGGDFNMNGGVYELTILGLNEYDKIIGDGTNSFFLNEGIISLNGDIEYVADYLIFDGFFNGSVGNIDVVGYDTENWLHHIETDGTLWFQQIPEPSTYATFFGILAVAFAASRRKK